MNVPMIKMRTAAEPHAIEALARVRCWMRPSSLRTRVVLVSVI